MKHKNKAVIVGHRGARLSVPENTKAAFAHALEHQVSQIETDLHVSKDGIVVINHDPFYLDASGNEKVIAELTHAELLHDLPDMVTLPELIEFVNRRTHLMLEIKDNVPTEPIVKILRYYLANGWQPSDFSIASFDFDVLKKIHKQIPELERIVLEGWSGLRALYRARQLDTKTLSMSQQYLWWGFVWWAVRHNHKIYTYPEAKDKKNYNHRKPERWVKYGLHGIITDKPENYS